VSPGASIFEMRGIPENLARQTLEIAASILNVKIKFWVELFTIYNKNYI
jgi:ribosomal protein L16/L10AE